MTVTAHHGGRPPAPVLPPMSETEFSDAVAQLAQSCGWTVAHFRSAHLAKGGYATPVQYDGKGFPDLVLVHPDRKLVLFRELKAVTGKLSPDQKRWALALNKAEADWATWWPSDWPEIVRLLTNGRVVLATAK